MDYKAGLYNIIRSYAPSQNKPNKVIKRGVSLGTARAHCSSPKTIKSGVYFDFFKRAYNI